MMQPQEHIRPGVADARLEGDSAHGTANVIPGPDSVRNGADSIRHDGTGSLRHDKADSAREGADSLRYEKTGAAWKGADSLRYGKAGAAWEGADSLRYETAGAAREGADSLRYGEADSLRGGADGGAFADAEAPIPSPWRDTTETALFGRESCSVQPERFERHDNASLTENAVFQGFVLLLAATYATLLYRNLGDVKTLLKRISRDNTSGERLSEEPGGNSFSRFLNVTTAIGMLFMGVIVVKYGDTLMTPRFGQTLSHGAVLALSLLATAAWCAVVLFQSSLIRISGAITLSQPFTSHLALLRKTYFALAVIITSPTLLLFALCPRGTGGVWFFVGAVELIITAVLYLKESLNLFISKKISILHWFLYLCTVEVFPISLLWLLAAR